MQKLHEAYEKANIDRIKTSAIWDKFNLKILDDAAYTAKTNWYAALSNVDEIEEKIRQTLKEHSKHLLKLHKKECGCAWTPENRNIFNISATTFSDEYY